MWRQWLTKIKEASFAILPIVFIVLVLQLVGLTDLTDVGTAHQNLLWPFLISALFMMLGLILFTVGADASLAAIGDFVGADLIKRGNLKLMIIIALVVGAFVTMAEPAVQLISSQVPINNWLFIVLVAVGVGVFLAGGLTRIVFKRNLRMWFILGFGLIFAITSLYVDKTGNTAYISIAFDAGGVTTGSLTVPFIIAFGASIAAVRGGKGAKEDSFGLISISSIGPIIAILLLGLISVPDPALVTPDATSFWPTLLSSLRGISLSVIPIAAFFFLYNAIALKLPRTQIIKIVIGMLYTFLGLVLFLTSITFGLFPVGKAIGQSVGAFSLSRNALWFLVLIGAILGAVSAIAEPAVYVLIQQVQDISGGLITKRKMLMGIAIGIAISVALSIIRIISGISLIYFLVPGYVLAITLSFFVPNIYTAVAFDSGGVASGTMTATFILPFAIGVCGGLYAGNPNLSAIVAENAFGLIALVSMTPLVVVQLLGFGALAEERMRARIARTRIREAFDDQIINFI